MLVRFEIIFLKTDKQLLLSKKDGSMSASFEEGISPQPQVYDSGFASGDSDVDLTAVIMIISRERMRSFRVSRCVKGHFISQY